MASNPSNWLNSECNNLISKDYDLAASIGGPSRTGILTHLSKDLTHWTTLKEGSKLKGENFLSKLILTYKNSQKLSTLKPHQTFSHFSTAFLCILHDRRSILCMLTSWSWKKNCEHWQWNIKVVYFFIYFEGIRKKIK